LTEKTVDDFQEVLSGPPVSLRAGIENVETMISVLRERDINTRTFTQAYKKQVGNSVQEDIKRTHGPTVFFQVQSVEVKQPGSLRDMQKFAKTLVQRMKKLNRRRRRLIEELSVTVEPLMSTKKEQRKEAEGWDAHRRGYERYMKNHSAPYDGMAQTWDRFLGQIRSMKWLGGTVYGHKVFLERLKKAQGYLATNYPRLVESGKLINRVSSSWRTDDRDTSYHIFGLAIDVDAKENPFLANEGKTGRELWTIWRAVWLAGGKNAKPFSPKEASKMKDKSTEVIWNRYRGASKAVERYFSLLGSEKRLKRRVENLGEPPSNDHIETDYTGEKSISELEQPTDIETWKTMIKADKQKMKSSSEIDISASHGFMNLRLELVKALRDEAGLTWGAVGFGPRESGDFMHFDMRNAAFNNLRDQIEKEMEGEDG
jgi:hypothetical protein